MVLLGNDHELIVDEISHLTNEEQAEKLADAFSSVSQEYEPLKTENINVPPFKTEDIPNISVQIVEIFLRDIKTCKAITKDDIPSKIFKKFANYLSDPIASLINKCIRDGAWPDIFKHEIVTPIPKVFPPRNIEDLRNISGLLTINKIAEKCIAKLIISDMKEKLDPKQYANQHGIGIQHYLINMLNRILTALDSKSETKAVLATLIDWKQAFPRQCPKLGIKAFISVGVRASFIPMLVNYLQH